MRPVAQIESFLSIDTSGKIKSQKHFFALLPGGAAAKRLGRPSENKSRDCLSGRKDRRKRNFTDESPGLDTGLRKAFVFLHCLPEIVYTALRLP
jgi:hypothetical protein